MKLTRRHFHVLRTLNAAGKPLPWGLLPDGNGHCSGKNFVSDKTMYELDTWGAVSQGDDFLWAITDAGRAALAEKEGVR